MIFPGAERSARRRLVTAGAIRFALVSGVMLGSVLPRPAESQLRRSPGVQPVATVRQGDLLIGVGLAHAWSRTFPLSGFEGRLWSVPQIAVAWGLADRAVVEFHGPLFQLLRADSTGDPAVDLADDARDGRSSDFGDFTIGLSFVPWADPQGVFVGGRFAARLPNSDEQQGIGTNSTGILLALLGGWSGSSARLTSSLGVEILEAPLENFEQNDVVAYAAELLLDPPGRGAPWRLAIGVDGRVSTRGRVPIGTENTGRVYFGVERRFGPLRADVAASRGYAGISADWALEAGFAWWR